MTPRETVEDWLFGIRVEIPAHYGAAKLFERYQALLDWPTIICNALTATAFVSSLSESDSITVLKAIAVLLSVAGTVLSTLRSFLDYTNRAKLHKAAAVALSKLRREIEETLAFEPELSREQSSTFRARWDEIGEKAPTIPDRQYALHKERIELQDCKIQTSGNSTVAVTEH